jgi:hypothetical protein
VTRPHRNKRWLEAKTSNSNGQKSKKLQRLTSTSRLLDASLDIVGSSSSRLQFDPDRDHAAPVTVLITYHLASGNTEKMAHGVAEAKAVAGVLKRVGKVGAD